MPLKEQPDYKEDYDVMLYDLMADEGKTEASFCKVIGISRNTFNEWMVEHPSFREARDRGHTAAEAYWVEFGSNAMEGKGVANRSIPMYWQCIMNNRFGWGPGGRSNTGPGTKTAGPGGGNNKTDSQIAAELQRLIDKSQHDNSDAE